jgi:hypothetical protein
MAGYYQAVGSGLVFRESRVVDEVWAGSLRGRWQVRRS